MSRCRKEHMSPLAAAIAAVKNKEFVRLPGLYRRWDLEHVLDEGIDFRLEESGATIDGTPLYSIFYRESCPMEVI